MELITDEHKSIQSGKQKILGITLVMTSGFIALLYLIIFGTITLPHIKHTSVFVWIWLSFVVASLGIGSIGIVNLLRSGFFSELKRHDLRIQLAEMGQRRKDLQAGPADGAAETKSLPNSAEPLSITEATTRELEGEDTVDKK